MPGNFEILSLSFSDFLFTLVVLLNWTVAKHYIQGRRVGLSSSCSLWCFSFLPLFALVLLSDSSSYELFIMQLNNEPKYFAIFTSSLTLSGVQGFCSRSLENGCAFWRSWRHFHLRLFLHPNKRQSQAGWMRERQCDVNCQSVTTLWAAALCIQIWLLYMYWFIPFRFASFSLSTLASPLLV